MCAIAVFGGPGSGAIVAQTLAALAPIRTDLRLIGFLNDVLPRGEHVSGTPVFGPFSSWRDLPEDVSFVAPLHKAGAMQQRVAIVQGLGIPEHRWATNHRSTKCSSGRCRYRAGFVRGSLCHGRTCDPHRIARRS